MVLASTCWHVNPLVVNHAREVVNLHSETSTDGGTEPDDYYTIWRKPLTSSDIDNWLSRYKRIPIVQLGAIIVGHRILASPPGTRSARRLSEFGSSSKHSGSSNEHKARTPITIESPPYDPIANLLHQDQVESAYAQLIEGIPTRAAILVAHTRTKDPRALEKEEVSQVFVQQFRDFVDSKTACIGKHILAALLDYKPELLLFAVQSLLDDLTSSLLESMQDHEVAIELFEIPGNRLARDRTSQLQAWIREQVLGGTAYFIRQQDPVSVPQLMTNVEMLLDDLEVSVILKPSMLLSHTLSKDKLGRFEETVRQSPQAGRPSIKQVLRRENLAMIWTQKKTEDLELVWSLLGPQPEGQDGCVVLADGPLATHNSSYRNNVGVRAKMEEAEGVSCLAVEHFQQEMHAQMSFECEHYPA